MATLFEPPVSEFLATRHSWIGGRATPGHAGTRSAINPATGEAFAQASLLDAGQAASAVAAAQAASPGWRALLFRERGALLLRVRDALIRRADELARLIEQEQGKPAAEAYAVEIFPALEGLKHAAREAAEALRDEPMESEVLLFAHKECRVSYAPYGVVLVITPWNYPFFLSLSGMVAALAAGNTVVLKPAPATAVVGLEIGSLFREAGFPEGVVNVVSIDDTLAPALVEDPRIDKILFVGSAATGRRVMASASRNLTPVILELGGKDAAVVCRDADLDQAARGIVWGAFVNAGQTCVSVERAYVEEAVADAFTERVVEQTRRLRVGNPAAGDVDIGPMTLERQRTIVEEHVADAVAKGARVLAGGARPPGPGFFYPPTVLTDVDHTMRIMRDETFGPVLPIMRVASLEEAVRLANDSDYGLTASGWTRDPATARLLQERLSAGVVTINDCVSSLGDPGAPYGGLRRSGIGRSHGVVGFREMAQVKYMTRDPSRRPMLWWYPYDSAYRRLMAAAVPALHSRSWLRRARSQLSLMAFGRFWRRVSAFQLVRNVDKLF
ncbi:MAG: aldehyde dehydrogenase family protein [Vicinamibacteria bacterium]